MHLDPNPNINLMRHTYPAFFADWDENPYRTFIGLLDETPVPQQRNRYGWKNRDDNDDDADNCLDKAIEELRIRFHWHPRWANPENDSFTATLDECLLKFFAQSLPLTEQNIVRWERVLETFLYDLYRSPVLEAWLGEHFESLLVKGEFAKSFVFGLERRLFWIALNYPKVFDWAIKKIERHPASYAREIEIMFSIMEITQTGEKQRGYDPRIFDWLPRVVKAHRRRIRHLILSSRNNKGSLFIDLVFGFLHTSKKDHLDYMVGEMNSEIRGVVARVFDLQEQAGKLGPGRKPIKWGVSYKQFLAEHAAECPYPPI